MANIKVVTISECCTLCGLCEQPDLEDVFRYGDNGAIIVRNNGLIDLDKYPKVLEIENLCPSAAIKISDVNAIKIEDKGKALEQLNHLMNKELRDFPFEKPKYYCDYPYDVGTYQAFSIPAYFCSAPKYFTDETAEDAGISEFKHAVFSQEKTVVAQYVSAYKVKQLQKYCVYEETSGNFYFGTNMKIRALLEQAVQLARLVTEDKLDLPDNFCEFSVQPDWHEVRVAVEHIQDLEKKDVDLSSSSYFHADADYYRTWVSTGGDFKHCYYDFSAAEVQFREDIDHAISDVIERLISGDVDCITKNYLLRAKNALLAKVDILQREVKKTVSVSDSKDFEAQITAFCHRISKATLPKPKMIFIEIYDEDYNDGCRFYSERDCIQAAKNRRERGYNAGLSFLKNLPSYFNGIYLELFAKELTDWKRELLGICDLCGRPYPTKELIINFGKHRFPLSLSSHEDVSSATDDSIRDYVDSNLKYSACYGSVDGVSYISECACEIDTTYDCDFKETLLGNIKEVNKRYGYILDSLYKFKSSAEKVSQACDNVLNQSDFMNNYFAAIKQSFVAELINVTGVNVNYVAPRAEGEGNTAGSTSLKHVADLTAHFSKISNALCGAVVDEDKK